jgi:hypothetical protein
LWPSGIFCGHLVYFMVIWYILWPIGILCGHVVYLRPIGICILWPCGLFTANWHMYFVAIRYILWTLGTFFGILFQEKSGSPASSHFQESFGSQKQVQLIHLDELRVRTRMPKSRGRAATEARKARYHLEATPPPRQGSIFTKLRFGRKLFG